MVMAKKLHHILSTLKHKATTTSSGSTSSTDMAVLRATPHHPSSTPPSSSHIAALLSFGHSSRLSATSLVQSLTARLSSARHPVVALKSLLCIHHLLNRGSFILVDALTFSSLPSSGRRSPLNLSSFRHPTSLALSSWVRWYARFLELLLTAKVFGQSKDQHDIDRLTSMLNRELIAELESLVGVMEEIERAPGKLTVEGNEVVMEVVRLAEEERVHMLKWIRVMVQEVNERVEELSFGDSVELSCLFGRLEVCIREKLDWDLFWSEVREVRERVEKREGEERARRVRRERLSESARVRVSLTSDHHLHHDDIKFGSCRWIQN